MPEKIIILEDNAERRAVMERCLRDRFHQFGIVFFDAAAPMKEFCDHHWQEILLIALDHDLELQPGPDGHCIDPGTGREMADYLASKSPAFPVILHTTNSDAAVGMEMVLRDAHWETHRVVPMGDLEWIPNMWFRTVRRDLVGPPATSH